MGSRGQERYVIFEVLTLTSTREKTFGTVGWWWGKTAFVHDGKKPPLSFPRSYSSLVIPFKEDQTSIISWNSERDVFSPVFNTLNFFLSMPRGADIWNVTILSTPSRTHRHLPYVSIIFHSYPSGNDVRCRFWNANTSTNTSSPLPSQTLKYKHIT